MGTDCPVTPHEQRLEELGHMQRLGTAPLDVWRAATYDAVQLLDRDDIGLLEPGRRADVVAFRGEITSFDGGWQTERSGQWADDL
jgi:imidazolonepropionase-like amidohydrolase